MNVAERPDITVMAGNNLIQVGEVLDKYELLERVGQGGMAVVYRGLDRSLKRVVAVKILHKHLSDYQEARDRFEREAQAVAKLRHENILEIFDYSGADEAKAAGSSYIVTEFIDGATLKQAITDRPLQFPEIGAMIVLQICRALSHAHAAGILHRDVKPENVMIRSDGVVKLMDFGISHMLDLERLTVTGQLLGSPAYMAPEHVEGRQLDFRTDVFAAGIVLYQLTVGRLPFEGKNPHEVLKRIAECKFVDPRQASPAIGNRLGRIILRAMAAEPADRFPNVGEMVLALEGYLEESGIAADKVQGELSRYFEAPVAYEQAFETRLVEHLTSRGSKLLAAGDRALALDVFDRVLTIDPDNEKVLAILEGINRKRRIQQMVLGAGAIGVLAFCAYMVHRNNKPIDAESIAAPEGSTIVYTPPPIRDVRRDKLMDPPVEVDAGTEPDQGSAASPGSNTPAIVRDAGATEPKAPIDAPPALTPSPLLVKVSPRTAEIQLGTGAWQKATDGQLALMIDRDRDRDRETVVRARHPLCVPQELAVKPGQAEVVFDLLYKPATVTPVCTRALSVWITDSSGKAYPTSKLASPTTIQFGRTTMEEKTILVEFVFDKQDPVRKKQRVRAGESVEVSCD